MSIITFLSSPTSALATRQSNFSLSYSRNSTSQPVTVVSLAESSASIFKWDDQSVENADKHQQDYDHHSDEGRGLAVFCLVKERVDLAGDQIPAGRDQEDDGADGHF